MTDYYSEDDATADKNIQTTPTTGHGLTIAIMDLLAKNKQLVLSVSYTLRKDGAVEFSYETHPEESA